MSDHQEAMRRMATLQQLNLQIVEARKLGDDDAVSRLKEQVRVLLAAVPSTLSKQAPAEPPPTPPTPPPSEPAPLQAHSPLPTDIKQIMVELDIVNKEIVLARKAGNDERLQVLRERAQKLMKLGMGS